MICNSRRAASVSLLVLLLGLTLGCFRPPQKITQPAISISLTSASPSLTIGQSTTIDATVYDLSSQGVTWSLSPLNFGSLANQTFDSSTRTASVLYTAPAGVLTPTTVTITATSITNPNIAKSVSFHFSPITIFLQDADAGLPLAPRTINAGAPQLDLLANVSNDSALQGVTWTLSPASGAGSLNVSSAFGIVPYFAPPSVAAPTNVTITATSISDPNVAASALITILPSGGGPNVVMLNVDGGPVPGQVHVNGAFTSVTICNPGSTSSCQTVDGILVDTGSYGLRILQSEIPLLKLSPQTDPLGNILENCAVFPDGSFLWGSVDKADVYIGGESASSINGTPALIQVIGNTPSVVPDGCSNSGVFSVNTAQLLGANGILGIGPEPTDCTISGVNYCDGSSQPTPPNVYYLCPSVGCTTATSPVLVNALMQVSNPIPLFSGDRNGVIIQLPAVAGPQSSALGTMTFGIGTELNNNMGSATVFTLDAQDHFTTVFNGQNLTSSFIDSGSEAYFFSDTLPACTVHTNLYCPASTADLSATLQGATQGTNAVNFSVSDADAFFSTYGQDAVSGTLGGPVSISNSCQGSSSCVFDWGLPFFYGRTVFESIDGQPAPFGTPNAPWWAY